MTDQRFDELAKQLSTNVSRRAALRGLVAAALGGVLVRAQGGDAATRAKVAPACARLGQTCSTNPASGAQCCERLACNAGKCCRPAQENCLADADCCPGNICRPRGLGAVCAPIGGSGDECFGDAQCVGPLVCRLAPGGRKGVCGPRCINSDCASGSVCCLDVCTPLGTSTNCSACDDVCGAGLGCCGGACTSLTTNTHCGDCVTICGAGTACRVNPFGENYMCVACDIAGFPCQLNEQCCSGVCASNGTILVCQ